ARHFAFTTGRETDKFGGVPFTTSELGLPILEGARAYIECRVMDVYPAGDHSLFVGEVISAESLNETEPLVFRQEDYF
ncbi:MAG: flavin reductase family protein, partial [Thermodesulfobacteriota bacterium]